MSVKKKKKSTEANAKKGEIRVRKVQYGLNVFRTAGDCTTHYKQAGHKSKPVHGRYKGHHVLC